ncbi:MAG: FHA domain-containing protein, partial [Clostridia bacterium]|nr:FHA domain-containing protein [Clostridia bacterium]
QFTVGRMLGHVDYCVMNNSAVGRQHIKITNNNGRYFICDLNSTNGTYIDEHEIPKNVDTEVFPGAKVTLANEDFKFVIE